MNNLLNGTLEPLLNKAKEHEKKYEWLQAAKDYEKASKLSFEAKDFLKAAEFQERIGFCYYRGAMQAETNAEFRSLLKKSICAYEKESELLEGANRKEHQVKLHHAHAIACAW